MSDARSGMMMSAVALGCGVVLLGFGAISIDLVV
jgi:hypothetical protein